MGKAALTQVIKIDEDKCVNCYACISACPCKYCMDGSGDKLTINPDLCIGCSNCIAACNHDARHYLDDLAHFLGDLKRGDKIIAIAAPAVASSFPGKYLNLNGYLKSIGIDAVFDVSLGAELTVISYINYIKEKNPRMVIAQPCPAIVTYIEIYHPELIPFLAPADSPMLHTMKMVREFYPQYRDHKIAVISPCVAKRREFDEAKLGDYNITMENFRNYIEAQNINLDAFAPVDYTGVLAERAVQFSSPGGLLDTAERFMPGVRRSTRKIEGVHTIYPYLTEVSELLGKKNIRLPLLVDCLNCEKGCNGGPGTGNCKIPLDELENPIRQRSDELEMKLNPRKTDRLYRRYHKELNKYWKKDLYRRDYRDISDNYKLKIPDEIQLQQIFCSMKKFSQKDIYDCTSCGYGSCRSMAIAIFNKLNKPENCAHFNLALLAEEKKLIEDINQKLQENINGALGLIEGMNNIVNNLNKKVSLQGASVDESSAVTGKMITSLQNVSKISRGKQESIKELIKNTSNGQESMRQTILSVKEISQSMDGIASAIKIISGIAANTNLLAMNAAIESAHAGVAGRGFAVVADEIRKLSETTRENSRNISKTLQSIIQGITATSKSSGDTDDHINVIAREINSFADTMNDLIGTIGELSTSSSEITVSLKDLREITFAIQTSYAEVLAMTDKLKDNLFHLADVSEKTIK